MKQKTLLGFFGKAPANASKVALEKSTGEPSSLKSSASSSATLVESRPKAPKKDETRQNDAQSGSSTSKNDAKKIREPMPSSSSPLSLKSSTSEAIDVEDDSGEESDAIAKKKVSV